MIEGVTKKAFYQVLFHCPGCREAIAPSDGKRGCEACMAWHHRDCFGERDGRAFCMACSAEAPRLGGFETSPEHEFRLCIATPCREPAVKNPLNRHLAGYCEFHAELEGRRQGTIFKASGGALLLAGSFFVPGVSEFVMEWLPTAGLTLGLGLVFVLALRGRRWLGLAREKWQSFKSEVKADLRSEQESDQEA